MNPTMVSRFQGSAVGTLIGDSMGLPWEILTRAQILEATDGEGIVGFRDRRPRYFKSVNRLPFPSPSDDYQHTRAMMRSLIRCGKLDLVDLARELLIEYKRCNAGWGGTTQTSMRELDQWFRSDGSRGRDPRKPATNRKDGKGTGNGPSMKFGPGALFYSAGKVDYVDGEKRWVGRPALREMAMRLGMMTHADPRASIASYALMLMLVESPFNTVSSDSFHLQLVQEEVEILEREMKLTDEDKFSGRLKKLFDQNLLFGDPARLSEVTGVSCFSLESIPFSIATFLRHPTDFRAGVLEAINAGGDTDSNAAIVGALIGANVGLEGIPEEWRVYCPETQEAIDLATQLYEVASRV